ncbi:hypothetical protein D1006_40040 [Burkholderia stabilis]|uniref:Uncharacterized protein n=1 Tax=Burkholderia stabilis TaxID=95485 RepID=A0A4V1PQL5_9BURK|nr:hypothetical protein [Burkholderia stabilis]RXV64514.1 hypothetical protein D1006_40040 [Burkholderia stabilis]
MTLNPTPNLQSLYRDFFALTPDEINNVVIGTPVRVRLVAPPRQQPEDAPTTPCAARTALRFLD